MFINREDELKALNKFHKSKKSEFIVIYGKRRVGKTELIKHFMKDKNSVYFLAQQVTEYENMKILSGILAEHFEDEVLTVNPLNNFNQLFTYLKSKIGKKKLVLAIDEFPYLIEGKGGITSTFQSGWDEILSNLPVTLILCGSSISMMEREVLGEQSPLFGRRTGQMLVKPFTFYQSRKFFQGSSYKKQLEFYTVLGGIPAYLDKFNESLSLEKNIENNILSTSAYLYSEVDFMLRTELREPRIYFSILSAIASGNTRTGEILNETGLDKNILHKYLSVLESLYVVKKSIPVTEDKKRNSRHTLYFIKDNFVKFYFRFMLPYKSMIEEGRHEFVLKKTMNDIKYPVSFSFEDACREWLINNWKYFDMMRIGRWWYKDSEIDLLGYDKNMKNALFAECKWTKKKIGENILDDLIAKSKLVRSLPESCNAHYALFARSGFTASLKKRASASSNIFLYDIEDLS